MPHEVTITLYTFDELDDKAKERAREWFREGNLDYEWWDSTYEDAKRVGLEITAFDTDQYAKGKLLQSAKEVAVAIIKEHGDTCETYKDAAAFLVAREQAKDEEAQEVLDAEFLKTLLEDYRIMLRHEAEWLQADEQVDESIRANEYTFEGNGKHRSA